jgi:broad-specificity NMP kinase
VRSSAGNTSHHPVTVAFMGLDGVGKSTQCEALEAELAARGRRPVRVHHASTKVPILRALKQRYHRAAVRVLGHDRAHAQEMEGNGQRLGSGGAVAWIVSMYFLVGSFLKSIWYPWRAGGRPLILDRCFLDDVVKVRWRLAVDTRVSGVLMRVVPKPTVVVVLEGDPAQTFQRKKAPTCTFEQYLEKRRILEFTLQEATDVGWVVERVGIHGRDAEAVFREVIRLLEERSLAPEGRSPGDDSGPGRHR